MKKLFYIPLCLFFLISCKEDNTNNPTKKVENKHHLNIPEQGIESLMESNSQKIIEGTDGSIVIMIGNVTRKEADITIKRDDKILDEKMVPENSSIEFEYEGNTYDIEVGTIKKPLLGEGKVELKIK